VAEVRLDEASFQKAVTDLCDWYGLRWHHEVDSRKSKRGLPDLVIIGSQRELKADDGKLRPDQNAWGGDLVASGSDWAVWKPEDWRSGRIRRELEAIR
jgi:hypothetical protein